MINELYKKVLSFKKKYSRTVAWRLRSHCAVASKFLDDDEEILYVFAAQKNDKWYDIISTNLVVMTNRRLVLASKRVLFGYFFTAITPDLFNDIKIRAGLLWGKVLIDTVGELVTLTNVDNNALGEIENEISERMMREKRNFGNRQGN